MAAWTRVRQQQAKRPVRETLGAQSLASGRTFDGNFDLHSQDRAVVGYAYVHVVHDSMVA